MSKSPFDVAIQHMLRRQLRRRGIRDPQVLRAMAKVPRERFVPEAVRNEAYADCALGIDCGQTISQPFIVALMTEALRLSGPEKVLEIGTGSGYQTAILAELAAAVISIERHASLSRNAAALLEQLGYRNVTLLVGDGSLGDASHAPFDRIMVAAAAPRCPPALFEQLREGGVLVMPIGGADSQILEVIRKVGGRAEAAQLSGCRFVPLLGVQGWPE